MKSNICKIDQGTQDLAAVFAESEKVAVYNELTHKQALQLRLICEEIDGMLPKLIDEFEGELWFEFEDGVCKVNLLIESAELTTDKKNALIDIAKNKKNSAAVGMTGKLRSAIEDFFMREETVQGFTMSSDMFVMAAGYSNSVDYTYFWSLEQYRNMIIKEEQREEWDELEKSVLASVADDVLVGIKGKQVNIVIVKKFA